MSSVPSAAELIHLGMDTSVKEIVAGVAGGGGVAESVVAAAKAEPELRTLLRVVEVPDRFVSGEGGALVNAVNGKVALPPGRKGAARAGGAAAQRRAGSSNDGRLGQAAGPGP